MEYKKNSDQVLIVFFNRMFNQPLELEKYDIPNVELSSDPRQASLADAVVFHGPNTSNRLIRGLKKTVNQLWVIWSMESDVNYPIINDPIFDLRMTYKKDADIWVPYFNIHSLEMMHEMRKPVADRRDGCNIASLISSHANKSDRFEYLEELSKHVDIHHYGRFMKNHYIKNDKGRDSKLEVYSRYHFVIAFENSISTDYVTEKYFDAILAGAIPIYMGAPNISDYAPGKDCHINVSDFEGATMLSKYLKENINNEKLRNNHLEWKSLPFRSPYFIENQLFETRPHPFVRLAELVKSCLVNVGNFIPQKVTGWKVSHSQGKLFLSHAKTEKRLKINRSVRVIWELCDGNASISSIQRFIEQKFPESTESIDQDVKDSIRHLQHWGAIEDNT